MSGSFSDFPELGTGFSSATDGTMAINGGFENRKKYVATHGLDPQRTVHAGLCHGASTAVVMATDGGKIIANTDGLITADSNVGLAMTAADCLLISVYDPTQKIIGLVHAGRRGLAADVVSKFFQSWTESFPTKPSDCIVYISPSICADHYTVSEQDAQTFIKWPDACQKRDDGIHLDLRRVAYQQLLSVGVQEGNININQRCTFEDENLFSYRRDHPSSPQLQVGYIMRGG